MAARAARQRCGALLALAAVVVAGCADPNKSGKGQNTGAVPQSRKHLEHAGLVWSARSGGAIQVTTPGAKTVTVTPPVTPTDGDALGQGPNSLIVAAVRGRALTVQRQSVGGGAWTTDKVALPHPAARVSLASNPRSSTYLALTDIAGGAGRAASEGVVSLKGAAPTQVTVPGAADAVGVSGDTIYTPGGAARSRLFESSDGKGWKDVTSLIPGVAPGAAANVSPDAPVFGDVLPMSDGSVWLPVTRTSAGKVTVSVYSARAGGPFSQIATIGPTGVGAEGPLSLLTSAYAGPGAVFAIPGAPYLVELSRSGGLRQIPLTGVVGTPDAISFQSADAGTIETTVSACGADKSNCKDTVYEYSTSDGGNSWRGF